MNYHSRMDIVSFFQHIETITQSNSGKCTNQHNNKKLKEKTVKVKGKWIEHYCMIANEIKEKEELDFLAFDISDIE